MNSVIDETPDFRSFEKLVEIQAAARSRRDRLAEYEGAGRHNVYVCERCGGHVVTRDLHHGVTPFMIGCKATAGCEGLMQSSMYRPGCNALKATFEWYRPETIEGLTKGEATHVSMGGLLLREMA